MQELFESGQFYCPICKEFFAESTYLHSAIENERARWIANMVTHYRHTHITSWNKCWERGGGRYRNGWFTDYDEEKRQVNERAKRQIIRKCRSYLEYHRIGSEDFKQLMNNDDKTLELARSLDIQEKLF